MRKIGKRALRRALCGVLTMPLFAFYSGCVTDLQMQDFIRSQGTLVTTNLLTSQVVAALDRLNLTLTGPQVTDVTIRTPTAPN